MSAPIGARGAKKGRGPPPRRRMDADARKEKLLALGLRAFSDRPYDEMSIGDLARAAKISKGLLYHYFPTKRDFYVATVREAARRLLAETETDASLSPLERLDRGLAAYLDFAERHRKAYVALLRGGVGADAEVVTVIEETRERMLERMVRDVPGRSESVTLALRGWIGFVEATSIDWLENRSVPRSDLLAMWTRLLATLLSE